MKIIGQVVLVAAEVTVGAFVAGWMFEAGRDAYKQDRREVVKEQVKTAASGWKDRILKFVKE